MNGRPKLLEPITIARIYLLKKSGKRSVDIQRTLGITTNPTEICKIVERYLDNNTRGFCYPNYKKAISLINHYEYQNKKKADISIKNVDTVPMDTSNVKDPFEILQRGYDLFTHTITAFIDALIENKIKEEQEKYSDLLCEYKLLQEQFKEMQSTAKNSN